MTAADRAAAVRAYFDACAARYDALYAARPETAAEDDLVAGWFKDRLPAGADMIELGCGTGWLLDHVGWPAGAYVGIDLSAAMVERARAKHPGYRVDRRDALGPWPVSPTERGGYGVAVAAWCLNNLPAPGVALARIMADTPLLLAVVRTPLDPAPMAVDTGPVPHTPWVLDEVTPVGAWLGLDVRCTLRFTYGGREVDDPNDAHYLGLEVRHA